MKKIFFLAFASIGISAQQIIYYNGSIVTMEGQKPTYVEAVVTDRDKIIFIGDKNKALGIKKSDTKMVDLQGKTLMPGFIEPHVHPSLAGMILPNDIISMNDWVLPSGVKKAVVGKENYIRALEKAVKEKGKTNEVFWVWGYHQLWHGDLSRKELSNLFPNVPVGVLHRSMHEVYFNDKAIEMMGLKENDFKENSQVDWAKGHFFEGGWVALVPKISTYLSTPEKYLQGLKMMSQLIQKNGITTIAEPGFPNSDFKMEYEALKIEMARNPPYDAYLIPNGTSLLSVYKNNEAVLNMIESMTQYTTHNIKFLPKQVKLFADGAIYSQLMEMKGGYLDGHQGEWIMQPQLLQTAMEFYWKKGYKIHMHANGDLGIQEVLNNIAQLQKSFPRENHRFTLHHMGYFDNQQASQIKELGVETSVNPYYLWALCDKYAEVGLGRDRAENLVRIKSLTDKGIPVSFHSDFAMAPLEPLTLAWTAVNRITSENKKVSQDQRLDVFTALKGITISAARTLNLENEIGSIKENKRANFVLLEKDPFKVPLSRIKDIKVLGVIYKGETYLNHTK